MTAKLDRREQLGLVCGLFGLTLVLLFACYVAFADGKGTYRRYQKSQNTLEQRRNELELAYIDKQNEEIRIASQAPLEKRLKERDARFDLFNFINKMLDECKLKSRASLDNNPSRVRRDAENQSAVRLTLQGVNLNELVNFLHKVYGGKNLVVMEQCDLSPSPKAQGLRCVLTFVTFKA